MKIRILEGAIHLTQLRTRIPFRYGTTTLTEMPHAFVSLSVDIDDQTTTGIAADSLPPKWFTKDPSQTFAAEIQDMLEVIRHALEIAAGRQGSSAFDVWCEIQADQAAWGLMRQLPPLLTQFGTSLVERALIEAVCRSRNRPFHELLLSNAFGIRPSAISTELADFNLRDAIPASPLPSVCVRHTVGLADPLRETDIPEGERLSDGLPQSLESCIRAGRLRHFKIKVSGRLDSDRDRLQHVAEIFTRLAQRDFAFTLDGNEQFDSFDAFREFWNVLQSDPPLREWLSHILFVEQPVSRRHAMEPDVARDLAAWPGHPPFIIDESDATLDSLARAVDLGYAGTSHKNCKGVFKSVGNACLIASRRLTRPGRPFVLSGEDLCNVGPVALLQDLAVTAALGIESVERNGHHYNAGLSQFPREVQEATLHAHPDLYHNGPGGWPTATLFDGRMALGSVNRAPFGVGYPVPLHLFPKQASTQGPGGVPPPTPAGVTTR